MGLHHRGVDPDVGLVEAPGDGYLLEDQVVRDLDLQGLVPVHVHEDGSRLLRDPLHPRELQSLGGGDTVSGSLNDPDLPGAGLEG